MTTTTAEIASSSVLYGVTASGANLPPEPMNSLVDNWVNLLNFLRYWDHKTKSPGIFFAWASWLDQWTQIYPLPPEYPELLKEIKCENSGKDLLSDGVKKDEITTCLLILRKALSCSPNLENIRFTVTRSTENTGSLTVQMIQTENQQRRGCCSLL